MAAEGTSEGPSYQEFAASGLAPEIKEASDYKKAEFLRAMRGLARAVKVEGGAVGREEKKQEEFEKSKRKFQAREQDKFKTATERLEASRLEAEKLANRKTLLAQFRKQNDELTKAAYLEISVRGRRDKYRKQSKMSDAKVREVLQKTAPYLLPQLRSKLDEALAHSGSSDALRAEFRNYKTTPGGHKTKSEPDKDEADFRGFVIKMLADLGSQEKQRILHLATREAAYEVFRPEFELVKTFIQKHKLDFIDNSILNKSRRIKVMLKTVLTEPEDIQWLSERLGVEVIYEGAQTKLSD